MSRYTSSQHSNFLDSDKKPKTSNNPFWARNEKKNFAERPLGVAIFGLQFSFQLFFRFWDSRRRSYIYFIQKSTTSPTPRGRWSSLRRASKLPKMLGHPLKGVNQDFLPLDAWTRRGEGRIALILDRINIRKRSYFLTKIFQHPICGTVSKAAYKSIVYKPSGSPFSLIHICMCESQ